MHSTQRTAVYVTRTHGGVRGRAARFLPIPIGPHSRRFSPPLATPLVASLRRTYNARMPSLRFEWDPRKAAVNRRKHGVSFEDARSVFADERARLIDDPDHSEDEDRFVLLGLSSSLRLLVVAHCYRAEGKTIRIISAREAAREEEAYYP